MSRLQRYHHSPRSELSVLLITSSHEVAEIVCRTISHSIHINCEIHTEISPAIKRLQHTSFSLVIAHLGVEGDGHSVSVILEALRGQGSRTRLIVLGTVGQLQRGIELLDAGAADYLEWPREQRRLALLTDLLTAHADSAARLERVPPDELIHTPGSELERLVKQLNTVASVQTTVLFQGETGTGKTALARILHTQSGRTGPLVEVNCAALPETLFESELFGHTKGAFTGAVKDRSGRLAAAAGGTLFLDEIDALSLTSQAKLLRVLESSLFEPIGSDETRTTQNVRFVAASNRSLEHEVANGRFRADLLFRLNVVTLKVPPLREQDPSLFVALVQRFVSEYSSRAKRSIEGVTDSALAILQAQKWPGNVRQLRNVIERAVALRSAGVIDVEDLPDEMRTRPGSSGIELPPSLGDVKHSAERNLIANTLRKTNNNRSKAAAELKISRNTLYIKLRQYGLLDVTS